MGDSETLDEAATIVISTCNHLAKEAIVYLTLL